MPSWPIRTALMTAISGAGTSRMLPILCRLKAVRPGGCAAAPDRTTIDQALIRGLATALPAFRRGLPSVFASGIGVEACPAVRRGSPIASGRRGTPARSLSLLLCALPPLGCRMRCQSGLGGHGGLDPTRDVPHESGEFARDRRGHLRQRLAGRCEPPEAPAQPHLRALGDAPDLLRQPLDRKRGFRTLLAGA